VIKLTVTEISVHKEDESPIFGDIVTRVRLADEGAGMFIKIIQDNHHDVATIRLDFNEIEYILKAIATLKVRDDE
jgi:hypothetical protein